MKRTLLALCAILMTMVGCTNGDFEELYEPQDTPPVLATDTTTFYASLEGSDEQTKTYLDTNIKLLWHAEDRISLFRSTLNEQFYFTGSTGANSGGFNLVPSDSWVTGNETSTNYGVYPYVETTSLTNAEEIRLTMPVVQSYAENSFGKGANTMVAATESSASRFLPFRNVGGYLLLKLYSENASIKSITLEGNNGEVLSGSATVLAKYGYLPLLTMDETGGKSVTLDCGESGVKLSSSKDEPTQFWMVVPPTTFEGGFTLTITDTNGNVITKSTTKSQTIERNTVKSMAAFEIARTIANNEVWYTASEEVTPDVSIGGGGFGANITSNVWNEVTGKGVITFDGNVTKVGNSAFTRRTALTSVTLPNGVTSISDYAFQSCTALSDVVIGDSVRYIGSRAFLGCKALAGITLPNSMATIGGEAFLQCGLKSIVLPEGLKTIKWSAFNQCDSLTSVTIPSTVTAIEEKAFANCRYLTQVICQATTPPTLGTKVFYNTWAYIDVPDDSIDAYKEADGWKGYADKIQ